MKNKLLLTLTLVMLVSATSPTYAESKKTKILKGVYNIAKDFIKSDSAIFFQSSGALIPKNNDLSGSFGQKNSFSPATFGSLNTTSYATPYQVSQGSYYPVANEYFTPDAQLMTSQGFNIEPNNEIFQPRGEIFLVNADKNDVQVILSELCAEKGWSISKNNNSSYSYENHITIPDSYVLTFYRYGGYGNNKRHLILTINQYPNGTSFKVYSSAFLVKEYLKELLTHFNSFYATQVSQFR
ncbi:MAG: hypothetical protein AB1782_11625 [Cyanobacteriota bacterium]